jgi:hypothetical protein
VADAVRTAATEFAHDHHGQLPTDHAQLTPYLKRPVDAVTIQKHLKDLIADPPSQDLTTLAPALRAFVEANGVREPEHGLELVPYLSTPEQQTAFLKLEQLPPEAAVLLPAVKAYAVEHNGRAPKNLADLRSYLTTPEQQTALRKLEEKKKARSE